MLDNEISTLEIVKFVCGSGGVAAVFFLVFKIGRFTQKFDSFVISVEKRFEKIDERSEKIDETLSEVKNSIARIDNRLARMEGNESLSNNVLLQLVNRSANRNNEEK